jgi:hypothetical protein
MSMREDDLSEIVRQIEKAPPDNLDPVVEAVESDPSWDLDQVFRLAEVLDKKLIPTAQDLLSRGLFTRAVAVADQIVRVLVAARNQLSEEESRIVNTILEPRVRFVSLLSSDAAAQARKAAAGSGATAPTLPPGMGSAAVRRPPSQVPREDLDSREFTVRPTRAPIGRVTSSISDAEPPSFGHAVKGAPHGSANG